MSEPVREELPAEEFVPEGEDAALPMAWHAFLSRFLLYFLPACMFFQAAWILTGRVYYSAEIRDRIYAGVCGMGALDRGLCLLLLGAAVLLLAARWKLRRLQRDGVRLLLSGLGLAALAWALYGAVRCAIAHLSPLNVSIVGQCAGYIALLLVNRSYYAGRRSLLQSGGGKEQK